MPERRSALIIACAEYDDQKLKSLPGAAGDAALLRRVLSDNALGSFDVSVLLNQTHYDIMGAIEEAAQRTKPDDLLLVHFSCHGIKDSDGRLYFTGRNTSTSRLRATGIEAAWVDDVMRQVARSSKKVLVLDCCYGGAYLSGMVHRGDERAQVPERFSQGRGFVVMTAADALQFAYEGDRVTGKASSSVFTRHFVRGIESGEADRNGDQLIGVLELYDYVSERVREEQPGQSPLINSFSLQEDIVLARTRPPQDGDHLNERLSVQWELAQQGGHLMLERVRDAEGLPLLVHIPVGSRDGDVVTRFGYGMPGRHGGRRGDLLVRLEIAAPLVKQSEVLTPHWETLAPGSRPLRIEPGTQHPLGAVPDTEGVNFSIFSERATSVQLLLFDQHDDPEPFEVIYLDPALNKTFHYWHVYVRGARPGIHYAYRVDGYSDVHGHGDRFNSNKVLIDPYAWGNTNTLWDRGRACGPEDNLATSMRSVVIDHEGYDWEGDKPLNRPMSETIIYEMHVGGFTKSPSSGTNYPGTYAGIVEKIHYLHALGITAVKLLPVFDFDDKEVLRLSPIDGTPLMNYWGYSTVSFFAPHSGYCVNPEGGEHLNEFRDMVKALHRAGIEVILDVVLNNTGEGGHEGPTTNFKGIDNATYYHLVKDDRQYYMDYSGSGNTLRLSHPTVYKMVTDCLEFWVREMHVDGFHFDETLILTRDEEGTPSPYPPIVWSVEQSAVLAGTKVIAEAWDAAGLYEIGFHPGYRWAEWNGKYRDAIRQFVKGDPGIVGEVANRIAGSADIYQTNAQLPVNSINFVTTHDGFCMNDLVCYDGKHNEANGEGNRDGIDDNLSWNCGVEGPTDDYEIEELRDRQVKNFFTILMLSQGVPMFLSGDEVRRTQGGNNDAYCQDNEINWFDWRQTEKNADMLRFFSRMVAFRKTHSKLFRSRFFTGQVNNRGLKDIEWHGADLYAPQWSDPAARALAFTMASFEDDPDLHVLMNMCGEGLPFAVPLVDGRQWYRVTDTALPSPQDIVEAGEAGEVSGVYHVTAHSVVVLASRDS